MFYCNSCAKKKGWQESLAKSVGSCEVCGKVAVCNDKQSSQLPDPLESESPANSAVNEP